MRHGGNYYVAKGKIKLGETIF